MFKAKIIDGRFAVICPKCKTYTRIPKEKLSGKHAVKIRCTCGEKFAIEAEHRELHRKETYLEGFFKRVHKKWDWDHAKLEPNMPVPKIMNCRIIDISKTGLSFFPLGSQHDIQEGHMLTIIFFLDDSANRTCLKRLVVRGVNANKISCEFADEDKNDPKIGYYLL